MINRDYGKKTTIQINQITNMIQGDRVWNTNINRYEYYTGSVWTNDDCVVMTNRHTATLSEGYFVSVSTTINNSVILANAADTSIGVVFRGGISGSTVVIAIQGNYNVYYGAASILGRYCNVNITNGTGTSSTTGQVGSAGICLETTSGAGLAKTNLQILERN